MGLLLSLRKEAETKLNTATTKKRAWSIFDKNEQMYGKHLTVVWTIYFKVISKQEENNNTEEQQKAVNKKEKYLTLNPTISHNI